MQRFRTCFSPSFVFVLGRTDIPVCRLGVSIQGPRRQTRMSVLSKTQRPIIDRRNALLCVTESAGAMHFERRIFLLQTVVMEVTRFYSKILCHDCLQPSRLVP